MMDIKSKQSGSKTTATLDPDLARRQVLSWMWLRATPTISGCGVVKNGLAFNAEVERNDPQGHQCADREQSRSEDRYRNADNSSSESINTSSGCKSQSFRASRSAMTDSSNDGPPETDITRTMSGESIVSSMVLHADLSNV
jgi:hypothetical protein